MLKILEYFKPREFWKFPDHEVGKIQAPEWGGKLRPRRFNKLA